MTELALGRDRVRRRERIGAAASPGTDARRVLQLVLAAVLAVLLWPAGRA